MSTPYAAPFHDPYEALVEREAEAARIDHERGMAEEFAYRERVLAQERLDEAELADLLREQDEEREGETEPREHGEAWGL